MAIWKLNYSPTSFINVETPEEDLSELEASHILESVLGGEEPLKTSYKDTQGYWLESDEDNIYRFFDNDDLKKATVYKRIAKMKKEGVIPDGQESADGTARDNY